MGTSQPIRRGDIWHVNLDPTIGHETQETRPAAIIQNNIGNKYSPLTIIAPITSQKTEKIYPYEVLINRNNSSIKKQSKILLDQIRAIDKKRLVRKHGKLSKEVIAHLDDAIKISLGLN